VGVAIAIDDRCRCDSADLFVVGDRIFTTPQEASTSSFRKTQLALNITQIYDESLISTLSVCPVW
jgi:hypothetical protein